MPTAFDTGVTIPSEIHSGDARAMLLCRQAKRGNSALKRLSEPLTAEATADYWNSHISLLNDSWIQTPRSHDAEQQTLLCFSSCQGSKSSGRQIKPCTGRAGEQMLWDQNQSSGRDCSKTGSGLCCLSPSLHFPPPQPHALSCCWVSWKGRAWLAHS